MTVGFSLTCLTGGSVRGRGTGGPSACFGSGSGRSGRRCICAQFLRHHHVLLRHQGTKALTLASRMPLYRLKREEYHSKTMLFVTSPH